MKSEKNVTGSRLAKRSFETRQSKIRKYAYIGVGIAVLIFVYMASTIGMTKQPVTGEKDAKKSRSSKDDTVGSEPFYDIGKASSKSSSSSSSAVSSSAVSSSSQASEVQPDNDAQASSATAQPQAETSSSVAANATPAEPSAQYAVLQPVGGQALYSWAISQGTTASEIYQLNPGITAANWSQYVGQSVRIR